jgi:hypothetical protein
MEIDARTSRCRWVGEPMNYSPAIEWMELHDQRGAAQGIA